MKHCGVKDKMTKEKYENKPGAIEVFCGCARMTKELQSVGFDAVGIDYRYNKDKPETKAYVELDLARPWGITELKKIIKDKKVKVAFIAPPCGSASAARLIRRKKGPDPKPLRSHRHPDGLPGLGLVDKQRVSTANKLYQAAADLAIFCQKNGISWVIENPTNSLMWETTPFVKLIEQLAEMGVEPKWTSMQMCMHGGDRDKKTTLMYGGEVSLEALSVLCDKSHSHKPWGQTKTPGTLWATSEERNYPRTFCKRVAKIFAKAFVTAKPKKKRDATDTQRAEMQVRAGKQPRRFHKDLIPEFKEIRNFVGATAKQLKEVELEDVEGQRICGDVTFGNVGKIFDSEPEDGGDGSRFKG